MTLIVLMIAKKTQTKKKSSESKSKLKMKLRINRYFFNIIKKFTAKIKC